jgi:hypothetical protein
MKFVFTAPFIAIGLLAGCASSPAVPTGMKAGQFVTFQCDGGKSFQARLASDGSTVRVRYEGGYELDGKGAGIYESDGWKLLTQGPGAVELLHKGKSAAKNCKSV